LKHELNGDKSESNFAGGAFAQSTVNPVAGLSALGHLERAEHPALVGDHFYCKLGKNRLGWSTNRAVGSDGAGIVAWAECWLAGTVSHFQALSELA